VIEPAPNVVIEPIPFLRFYQHHFALARRPQSALFSKTDFYSFSQGSGSLAHGLQVQGRFSREASKRVDK